MSLPCLALAPNVNSTGIPAVAVPLRYATGPESVVTRIAIRLWTIRGVWPDDINLGLDHLTLSAPNVDAVVVEAAVRRQVAAVDGVVEILDVTVVWPGAHRSISVRVLVDSEDGPVLATVGDLGTLNGYAPGAWYLVGKPNVIVPGRF